MNKNIYIVECRNARRDVINYSVEADSADEARSIFEAMKNNGETYERIRETISRYEYTKDKI